jgi:trimeric autotransporter adhesin
MKRLAIATIMLAVGAAGCGSSSTSPSPSNLKIFQVQLFPSNEVPPITNAEQSGRGTAVITIHTDTNTVDFAISMNSFPANTNVILAHIHPGPAGVNGGALIGVTGLAATTPLLLTDGTGTYTANGVAAAADATTAASRIQSILAAPQNFYFNVHTSQNGGGVMRGQLQ